MSNDVVWTKLILETFVAEAELSTQDEEILRLHVKGHDRISICEICSIREATYDRAIRRLKDKYDAVASYEPLLPMRKSLVKKMLKITKE